MSRTHLSVAVVLFLIAAIVPMSFSAGGTVFTGVRLVALVMFFPVLTRLFSGQCGPILPTDWLLALHFLLAVIATAIHNPDRVVANMGSTGLEILGGYLLGRGMIRNSDQMAMMIKAFAILICLTLPLALFEAFTGRNLMIELINALPIVSGASNNHGDIRMHLKRVQMGYQTPIHYGLLASLGIALCFVGLRGQMGNGLRWMLTAGICACAFLSLSSGALLPMMLQIMLILWARVFDKQAHPWRLLLGLVVMAYLAIDLLSNRSPYRVFMSYATFSPGTAYWRDAINYYGMQNVWGSPWIGIGMGDWVRPEWMHSSSVDNFWLVVALRYGIPSALLIIAAYAVALWQIGRRNLGGDRVLVNLRRGWMFVFCPLAFTLYTVHIWSELYALIFFLLGSGMWLATADPATAGSTTAPVRGRPPLAWTRFTPQTTAVDTTAEIEGDTVPAGAAPEAASAPDEEKKAPRYSRFAPDRHRPGSGT